MIRVVPVDAPGAKRQFGFMAGHGKVEADLKKSFKADIEGMFTPR